MKHRTFLLLFPLLCSFSLMQDEDPRLRNIVQRFSTYMEKNLQQKAYLHMDRNVYEAPGDIWFKAYLISGPDQKPDTLSDGFIVELLNPRNIVVQSRQIRMKKGAGNGDFHLTDTIPEGTYTIRAYTGWMNNYRDFVFTRSFYVKNPANADFISAEDLRFNKRMNRNVERSERNFGIQFLPESGILARGITSRVAFRAENDLGKGVQANGTIYDEKDREITRFNTVAHGLGSFMFRPEKGMKYHASVRFEGGKPVEVSLPEVNDLGYVMLFTREPEGFMGVHIASSFPLTGDPQANDVILIGQTNGKIYYAQVIDMPLGNIDIRIAEELFPPGITQFTLFNGRGAPVAERLVFVRKPEPLQIVVSGLLHEYETRNQAEVIFMIKENNKPVSTGSYSVSVALADSTEDEVQVPSIAASFLLTSDLKGVVEDADHLLTTDNEQTRSELDLVMITHGWRRFSWPLVLSGKYPDFGEPAEKKLSVTGRITRELLNIPVPHANVYLSVLNTYNDYYKTLADENGYFRFDGLDYPDTINLVMEANKPNGRKNVLILIDENDNSMLGRGFSENRRQEIISRGDNWRYRNVRHPDYSAEVLRKKEKLENTKPYKIHSAADNVIYMNDVPEGYSNLFQVLQGRVPGVSVTGDEVIIRGINTFYGNSEPLYLIDGIMVDKGTFGAVNPRDVELIEVIKGPGSAVYGSRGGNGIIAAYTKRGEFMKKGYAEFSMLGYSTPRIFYSPVYTPVKPDNREPDNRKTLIWLPDILPDQQGNIKLPFFTSDQAGSFCVTLEGMDKSGKTGSLQTRFNVH